MRPSGEKAVLTIHSRCAIVWSIPPVPLGAGREAAFGRPLLCWRLDAGQRLCGRFQSLYYSCIKDTPYRWLNLLQLCQLCFPHYTICRIRYFTARVRATDSDPQKPQRQALFIRALQTLPNLSVHYGTFLTHTVTMRLANPPPRGPYTADVVRTEEKGSDVNLASYMLVDGFDRDYELAIVVSNDSDLVEPIRLVRERLGLSVGLLNPQMDERKTAWALMKAATFYRTIRRGVLQASQFPPILSDAHGQFFKPPTW